MLINLFWEETAYFPTYNKGIESRNDQLLKDEDN